MYPCFSYMFRAPRRANRCSSLAGPGTTWNPHASPNTGTVRRPANLFLFARELIEVIFFQPRQAQRRIAVGNRDSRSTMACSVSSGGSSLQRVISSTAPSASAVTSPMSTGCDVNPFSEQELEPFHEVGWLDVISSEVVTVIFFLKGGEGGWASQLFFSDASKPIAGCAVFRTCNVTCGAKHHRLHINTMKTNVCLREKNSATLTCGSNPSRVRARSS